MQCAPGLCTSNLARCGAGMHRLHDVRTIERFPWLPLRGSVAIVRIASGWRRRPLLLPLDAGPPAGSQ
jgi:hypothetical protein